MKTLDEVKYGVATECGYKNFEALADEMLSDYELFEFYLSVISIEYASQALDDAAESVSFREMTELERREGEIDGIENGMGDVYCIDEQSILKIKDQLK